MVYLQLSSLPVDHPLRNTPLAAIGAEYRNRVSGSWKPVLESFHIGRHTYNQLGEGWHTFNDWRALDGAEATR